MIKANGLSLILWVSGGIEKKSFDTTVILTIVSIVSKIFITLWVFLAHRSFTWEPLEAPNIKLIGSFCRSWWVLQMKFVSFGACFAIHQGLIWCYNAGKKRLVALYKVSTPKGKGCSFFLLPTSCFPSFVLLCLHCM